MNDIYSNPENMKERNFEHNVLLPFQVGHFEKKVRKEKYPGILQEWRLYMCLSLIKRQRMADYFMSLGRPTYSVVKIKVNGCVFCGDAYKCFDGSIYEEENLKRAEIYWKNEPNEDGNMPIVEVLVNGEIEVIEIMKELNVNI